MRTRIIFILCSISYLFLTSCGRTYCPAFPEHIVDYFPYKENDTLLFVNHNNDSVSFVIDLIGKTEDHSYGWRCGCSCSNSYVLESFPSLHVEIFIDGKACIYISLSNGYFDRTDLTRSRLILCEETGKNPLDLQNSDIFGETVLIEASDQQISSIVIVKGIGVTEFYDRKNNFQWKSINN